MRNYFDFKLGNSQKSFLMNSKNFDADEILYELSSGLRADILLHVERHIITKIPFFNDKVCVYASFIFTSTPTKTNSISKILPNVCFLPDMSS